MFYYTNNPVADAERYYTDQERKQEEWESKLPLCSECGKPIDEEFCWEIDGEIYHCDCADKLFCKRTEDCMED